MVLVYIAGEWCPALVVIGGGGGGGGGEERKGSKLTVYGRAWGSTRVLTVQVLRLMVHPVQHGL